MTLILENRQNDKPGTHVFIIGVGDYPHAANLKQVEMAARSALAVARWITKKLNCPGTSLQTVRLLISGKKTQEAAEKIFEKSIQSATIANVETDFVAWKTDLDNMSGSIAVFYFAGHGFGNNKDQSLLLEDYNAKRNAPLSGAINYSNIVQSVNVSQKSKNAWFFIDACRDATLEQFARGDWGVKLDGNVSLLAGNVPCCQIFATGAGKEALGLDEGETFFSQALLDALDKNGYSQDPSGWIVKPSALQEAININLKRACEAKNISARSMPRVEALIPDVEQSLHFRSEADPPEFLVQVTCMPMELNAQCILSYSLKSTNQYTLRQPNEGTWYSHVRPGLYHFKASRASGELREAERYIIQPFVTVHLKETV